jgi:hypothetical protein
LIQQLALLLHQDELDFVTPLPKAAHESNGDALGSASAEVRKQERDLGHA